MSAISAGNLRHKVTWLRSTPWVPLHFYGHLVTAHNGPGAVAWEGDGSFQSSTNEKRWPRELRQAPKQASVGNGPAWVEEMSQLHREPARVTKERVFGA